METWEAVSQLVFHWSPVAIASVGFLVAVFRLRS